MLKVLKAYTKMSVIANASKKASLVWLRFSLNEKTYIFLLSTDTSNKRWWPWLGWYSHCAIVLIERQCIHSHITVAWWNIRIIQALGARKYIEETCYPTNAWHIWSAEDRLLGWSQWFSVSDFIISIMMCAFFGKIFFH